MGQDPGATGAAVTESSDPAEIRQQVEATREELGDTVAALAAKADVKAQAKQKIQGVKATVSDKKEGPARQSEGRIARRRAQRGISGVRQGAAVPGPGCRGGRVCVRLLGRLGDAAIGRSGRHP